LACALWLTKYSAIPALQCKRGATGAPRDREKVSAAVH
jgi:hypothetical protein